VLIVKKALKRRKVRAYSEYYSDYMPEVSNSLVKNRFHPKKPKSHPKQR